MYNVLVYPVLRLKLDKLGEKRPSLVNSDFTIAGHFPQLLVECKSRKEIQPNRLELQRGVKFPGNTGDTWGLCDGGKLLEELQLGIY